MDFVTDFVTGKLPYTMELTILCQAFTGAMGVKGGRNKSGNLHWFHAFVLGTIAAFAGGLFNFLWMGKPTSMISNDVVFASCVITFVSVNYIPFFFDLANVLPFKLFITVYATLFKSLGMVGFVSAAHNAFAESPSAYYPIPTFGPIWNGIMLGNMGGFVTNGVDGYLAGGIPWPFQNGMFCAPLFHFYANDKSGPIGIAIRSAFAPLHAMFPDLDDRAFAIAFVGLFMQVVTILQLPLFFGPSFSPFTLVYKLVGSPLEKSIAMEKSTQADSDDEATPQSAPVNRNRNRNKKSKSKSKRKKA